VKRGVCDLQEI